MAKIVVALGGNALSRDGKATAADQLAVANETAAELVKLIAAGHTLAIVHGNGPQIGNIILHEEAINTEKTPTMPVDVAGAMSQGQIGYWLQNALRNQLEQTGIKKPIASIITQVLVSKDDPAFKNPSKPIGPFLTEEEAKILVDKTLEYMENKNVGAWKNRVIMLADNGDNNLHQEDCETTVRNIQNANDELIIKKYYWLRMRS